MLHRTRTWAHFALISSVVPLATLGAFAQDSKPAAVGLRPDAPPYALHGLYWVGTLQMDATTDFHPTQIQIWYPAQNPDSKPEAMTYLGGTDRNLPSEGHALLNAEPNAVSAPYPLVIFAHCLCGGFQSAVDLCEHLASQGFVVMAINYGDSMNLAVQMNEALSLYTRPKDVSWQIDYAEQLNTDKSSKLQGVIDLEHIGIVGHSYGGYTALVSSGALLDLNGPTSWSVLEPDRNLLAEMGGSTLQARFCSQARQIAELAGLSTIPKGHWPSWADSRIDALVSLAPVIPFFGSESTKTVTIPTMMIYGTKDGFVFTDDPLYQTYGYDNLGSKAKSLVLFNQADHSIFTNDGVSTPWIIDAGMFWACSDPVWDMNRAHDLINHFTTAFLLDVLKGDKEAHKALLAENVSFPGVNYKTTMK